MNIIIMVFLFICADEEEKFAFKWIRDGVEVTSFLTQISVSRYVNGVQNDAGMINYTWMGVSVSADGKSLTQRLYYQDENGAENIHGSFLFLLNGDGTHYEMLDLVNKEISFDVEQYDTGCGSHLNLYTVEMPRSGLGAAGASHGTGYCDAMYGKPEYPWPYLACTEFDLWHANQKSTEYAAKPCSHTGQFMQSEEKSCTYTGCVMHPYWFEPTFYGDSASFTVDSSRKFTVVTQFLTDDNNVLREITRHYVQDGRTIPTPARAGTGAGPQGDETYSYSSLTPAYCSSPHFYTGDAPSFGTLQASYAEGHVLVFLHIAEPDIANMDWLNSGVSGPCTEGVHTEQTQWVREHRDAKVTWSNLQVRTLKDVPNCASVRRRIPPLTLLLLLLLLHLCLSVL